MPLPIVHVPVPTDFFVVHISIANRDEPGQPGQLNAGGGPYDPIRVDDASLGSRCRTTRHSDHSGARVHISHGVVGTVDGDGHPGEVTPRRRKRGALTGREPPSDKGFLEHGGQHVVKRCGVGERDG